MVFKRKEPIVDIERRKSLSETNLKKYATISIEELYEEFESSRNGLTNAEADERLEKYGINEIVSGEEKGPIGRFMEALINPFNIVLFLVAAINFITEYVSQSGDYSTMIIILILIIVSSLISFIQGERSNEAAAKLSKMVRNTTNVLRDGEYNEIDMEQVVPGDIIRLGAGDFIPGDVRFLFAKDAFVGQSSLTGESQPVEKYIDVKEGAEALTDITNLGFMGTNVISGSALVLVLTTGNETYFGSMAESLSGDRAKNSFERGIEDISRLLISFMLVMVPVIFIVNGFVKGNWGDAFLFALSMAVGLTPEMLPVIINSTLSVGAVNMSKKQTIVKNISSIQAFGEMDILCTDKTGTLTEDEIVLEKYLDVEGHDDKRVLRHAFLNSYFQTGLKNLIDVAVINRAEQYGIDEIIDKYKVVDEVPFDFTRRRMSVILEDDTGKRQLITKGAVEEMISVCKYIEIDGKVKELDVDTYKRAMDVYRKHNEEGLRIIAVAQKNEIKGIKVFGVESEIDMVLIGFIGFLDPPKESSADAIEALRDHGVRTVVLTGDSEGVAVKVCNKVGLDVSHRMTGSKVESLNDEKLKEVIKTCNLFSKISPTQKERIVRVFQEEGHTVGYLGDGINDAPALRQSDVGISVDSAVDIAKETADIILLKKDLMVLEEGVISGRRTFGNIQKYIKMAVSGNFGNMIAVLVASIFLPFLPMLPVQILIQNLLNDFSQIGLPFDNVDEEYLQKPRRWDTESVKTFTYIMGPLSSVFDIMTFLVLYYIIGANSVATQSIFHGGWFIFGTLSQVLIVHMIRTGKVPFIESIASRPLILSTLIVTILACLVAFTELATLIDMSPVPALFVPWLMLILVLYAISTQVVKHFYLKKYDSWI